MIKAPLPLSEQVDIYSLERDIILFKNVFRWGGELIEHAEGIGGWGRSLQVSSDKLKPYANSKRTSSGILLSHKIKQDWLSFEVSLGSAFHSCVLQYKQLNTFAPITKDTGFELLRYCPGEEFELHVDAVELNLPQVRQVSAVAYLNDDFEGGSIVFPRQGVEYQPSAGDIIMFPSNFCYPHASRPVISGIKYCVVTWFVYAP